MGRNPRFLHAPLEEMAPGFHGILVTVNLRSQPLVYVLGGDTKDMCQNTGGYPGTLRAITGPCTPALPGLWILPRQRPLLRGLFLQIQASFSVVSFCPSALFLSVSSSAPRYLKADPLHPLPHVSVPASLSDPSIIAVGSIVSRPHSAESLEMCGLFPVRTLLSTTGPAARALREACSPAVPLPRGSCGFV